jgi:hypothetical protein
LGVRRPGIVVAKRRQHPPPVRAARSPASAHVHAPLNRWPTPLRRGVLGDSSADALVPGSTGAGDMQLGRNARRGLPSPARR